MKDEELTVEDLVGVGDLIEEDPTARKPKTSSGGRKPPLKKRLQTMIELIGNVTAGFDKYDGTVIVDNAGKLADALVDLANESPRAKRVLEGLLEGGAWAGVGAVIGWEIVTPIAVHHRMLPEPINQNLADIRGVPLKAPKALKPDRTLRIVPDGQAEAERTFVSARDPKTGEPGMFPVGPDGRPVFPGPEADDDPTG